MPSESKRKTSDAAPALKRKKSVKEADEQSKKSEKEQALTADKPKTAKKRKQPEPETPAPESVEEAPKAAKKQKKAAKADDALQPPADAQSDKKKKKKKDEPALQESAPLEKPSKKEKKEKKSRDVVADEPEEAPPVKATKKAKEKAADVSAPASKAKGKARSPSPIPVDAEDDDDVIHGLSTDDEDSSDDEGYMDVEVSAADIAKLPTIAKDDATVKRKLENAKRKPAVDRGVLVLSRIPHGFYEEQAKAYFTQFGNVTRIRISRNKKVLSSNIKQLSLIPVQTGKSKHYGFIEFDSSSVAQIVAETMDNYLLMGHILQCKVIPKDEVHPELWIGANRKWRPVPKARLAQSEHNKPRTKEQQLRSTDRLLKRQEQRQQKLAKAGIEYDFGNVGYKAPKAVAA
ncbi:RNA-binding domain-containing protein [Mycena kentingensis (nom. inval.)]|nr:RNA-binding domain-containing protein [Mycena kentingensis (nom. inval.)]